MLMRSVCGEVHLVEGWCFVASALHLATGLCINADEAGTLYLRAVVMQAAYDGFCVTFKTLQYGRFTLSPKDKICPCSRFLTITTGRRPHRSIGTATCGDKSVRRQWPASMGSIVSATVWIAGLPVPVKCPMLSCSSQSFCTIPCMCLSANLFTSRFFCHKINPASPSAPGSSISLVQMNHNAYNGTCVRHLIQHSVHSLQLPWDKPPVTPLHPHPVHLMGAAVLSCSCSPCASHLGPHLMSCLL